MKRTIKPKPQPKKRKPRGKALGKDTRVKKNLSADSSLNDVVGKFLRKSKHNSDRFWEAGPKGGRPPFFSNPDHLLECCKEYFQWVDDHPLEEYRVCGLYYGEVVTENVPKKRPMTINGLCIFLGMTYETWVLNYRNNEKFIKICQMVEYTIREQKFAGAAAGFFNHAIIARDLGLVDKKDVTSDGEKISAAQIHTGISAKEAEQLYKQMLKQGE